MQRFSIGELRPEWVEVGPLRYGCGVRLRKCPLHEACGGVKLMFRNPSDGFPPGPILPGGVLYGQRGEGLSGLSVVEAVRHDDGLIVIEAGRVYAWLTDDG